MGRVDDLKPRYEKFSQGDIDGATDIWSDDFTWEGGNTEGLPGSGTHEGKDAALQVLGEAVGAWDNFELTPDEWYEEGDTAIVLAHTKVTKGDKTEEIPVVHIWRFRDGEVTRLQILTDTLQSARILGVA